MLLLLLVFYSHLLSGLCLGLGVGGTNLYVGGGCSTVNSKSVTKLPSFVAKTRAKYATINLLCASMNSIEGIAGTGGGTTPDFPLSGGVATPKARERSELTAAIHMCIDQRVQYRYARDYASADRIKDLLKDRFDVKIFDRTNQWTCRTLKMSGLLKRHGRQYAERTLPPSAVPCKLTRAEIQSLVDTRTAHRRARLFSEADSMRAELLAAGVELMDQSNEWCTYDGRLSGVQSFDFRYNDEI